MGTKMQDYLLSANKYDLPKTINESDGISIDGQIIKSVLLSTDLSFIQNLSADSVMVVNPFDKSNEVAEVIIEFSKKPVFCDIGGGLLREEQTLHLATEAFEIGAAGVVLTKPTPPEVIHRINAEINGLLIYTVMLESEPFKELVDAGVDIFNITTGEMTSETVSKVRNLLPQTKIMANGGPYDSTIRETIKSGANAIVFNPPTATEILRSVFDEHRFQKA